MSCKARRPRIPRPCRPDAPALPFAGSGSDDQQETPAVTLEEQKMFLDPTTYCAPELEKFSADDLPVFPRAIFHMMELSAFGKAWFMAISPS